MFDEAAQVLEGIGPEESSLQSQKSTSNLNMNTPMNPNKALWEKGDFTRIAESMRESGEALIQRLGISNGLKVLDLGCGDGTTAITRGKTRSGGAWS
jgi:cyclopropane fatty-acyl-phospholipid synthase-like methyltransferase